MLFWTQPNSISFVPPRDEENKQQTKFTRINHDSRQLLIHLNSLLRFTSNEDDFLPSYEHKNNPNKQHKYMYRQETTCTRAWVADLIGRAHALSTEMPSSLQRPNLATQTVALRLAARTGGELERTADVDAGMGMDWICASVASREGRGCRAEARPLRRREMGRGGREDKKEKRIGEEDVAHRVERNILVTDVGHRRGDDKKEKWSVANMTPFAIYSGRFW
jgi:hypothetical protein